MLKRWFSSQFIILLITVTGFSAHNPEEGMYPLSELQRLNLKAAGLKIDMKDVYNPNGISLIDALVRVGGCTGSFVSNEGLIITNHHCAFDAVQSASSTEHNYIDDGFLATSREKEIPAPGLTIRITESYKDVSEQILKATESIADPGARNNMVTRLMKEIAAAEEKSNPKITAEVSEMFAGKSYVLFRYKNIKDVRLVYVPQRSIGEFGGESDNWVWPRHTGDFSFVRGYVAPNGEPAAYSKSNVPFTPKKFLKVNPSGVDDGDFVFILGYPGRTFRHQPFQFLQYQNLFELPFLSDLYEWQINTMEALGKKNESVAIKNAARIKTMANRAKNYRGKLQGLSRTALLANKQKEENDLREFINTNPELKKKYGSTLPDIDENYKQMMDIAYATLWYPSLFTGVQSSSISTGSILTNMAKTALDYSEQLSRPDVDRKTSFQSKNLAALQSAIESAYNDFDMETDKLVLGKLMLDAYNFPSNQRIEAVDKIVDPKNVEGSIKSFISQLYSSTGLTTLDGMKKMMGMSSEEIRKTNDPAIKFVVSLIDQYDNIRSQNNKIQGSLNKLLADLLDVKQLFLKKAFVPDANSTLRLTYGNIKGYSPADATWMNPITTLKGVVEKGTNSGDYKMLPVIKTLYDKKDFGNYKHKKLNDVPVAVLYNMDTTGGNSGSPVLNAYGELIAVNFDRAYGATINDYGWSEDYSRSIGVDIRYVLWVTEKIGKADFLIREMGVK